MSQTAELVEVAIFVVAVLALFVSALMLGRSWHVYIVAVASGQCDAIRLLAWMRTRNELGRVLIVAGVAFAGYVMMTSEAPAIVTPNRAIFQGIWLGIALICLSKSLLNERDTRCVAHIIEREQTAGRMGISRSSEETTCRT